jgi:hypothetical protein
MKMTREEARAALRLSIKPDSMVYTILRHVGKTGTRHISVFVVSEGLIKDISYLVADALGLQLADDGGVKYAGEGHELVTWLGDNIYPPGGGDSLTHVWL